MNTESTIEGLDVPIAERCQPCAGAVKRIHSKLTGSGGEGYVSSNPFHPDGANPAVKVAGRLARKGWLGFERPPVGSGWVIDDSLCTRRIRPGLGTQRVARRRQEHVSRACQRLLIERREQERSKASRARCGLNVDSACRHVYRPCKTENTCCHRSVD